MSDKQNKYEYAEKQLRVKLAEYTEKPSVKNQVSEAFFIWKDDPHMIVEFTSEEDIDDQTFTRFMDWFMFDFKTLDTGRRIIDLLIDDPEADLTDIEMEIAGEWKRSVLSILEVRSIEGINFSLYDIFTGKVVSVTDRNTAEHAKTTDLLFARPLKTGDKYYFSGVISIYPNIFKETAVDFFNEHIREYRRIHGRNSDVLQFLRDWGYLLYNHMEEVVRFPHFLTRDGEEFTVSTSRYRCNDSENASEAISAMTNTEEIADLSSSFRAFSIENKKNRRHLGNIEIENDTITIKCNSKEKLQIVKNQIEKVLGENAEHIQDTFRELDNLTESAAPPAGNDKADLLPSSDLSSAELEREFEDYYSIWLFNPHEKLGGISPADAMKSQEGREKLETVLKELENIYEHAKRAGEPYYDIRKLRIKLRDLDNKNR